MEGLQSSQIDGLQQCKRQANDFGTLHDFGLILAQPSTSWTFLAKTNPMVSNMQSTGNASCCGILRRWQVYSFWSHPLLQQATSENPLAIFGVSTCMRYSSSNAMGVACCVGELSIVKAILENEYTNAGIYVEIRALWRMKLIWEPIVKTPLTLGFAQDTQWHPSLGEALHSSEQILAWIWQGVCLKLLLGTFKCWQTEATKLLHEESWLQDQVQGRALDWT